VLKPLAHRKWASHDAQLLEACIALANYDSEGDEAGVPPVFPPSPRPMHAPLPGMWVVGFPEGGCAETSPPATTPALHPPSQAGEGGRTARCRLSPAVAPLLTLGT
jgi:hypothetical protein